MYYRRKILLSLFEVMGDELGKIDFQKLLFLLGTKQKKASFDFVPYKFGCFSFQANADLRTMAKYEQIVEKEKKWQRIEEKKYFSELKADDQQALSELASKFWKLRTRELIKYTYQKYPYYAINSVIAEKILDVSALQEIQNKRPTGQEKGLFTIGYEGISLEQYLNKLIKKDIKVLVDVRKNSRSMKYGFNKNQLKNACEGVGITFFHYPQLGIESNKRSALEKQSDYDTLFSEYAMDNLKRTQGLQKEIIDLVVQFGRVALTCFEANICQCHRKPLAESIVKISEFNLQLTHI